MKASNSLSVPESVPAAPFVNAVLRKLAAADLGHPLPSESSAEGLGDQQRAFPSGLSNAGRRLLELNRFAGFVNTTSRFLQPRSVFVMQRPKTNSKLRDSNSFRVLCFPLHDVFCMETLPSLQLSGRAHALFQDEASQGVAALVGRGASILDCCAAPGGKTAAMADRNPGADIAAVDLHPHRARLLRKLCAETIQPPRPKPAISRWWLLTRGNSLCHPI